MYSRARGPLGEAASHSSFQSTRPQEREQLPARLLLGTLCFNPRALRGRESSV
jgi:hypothetical protein